jgi:hypothetical protein
LPRWSSGPNRRVQRRQKAEPLEYLDERVQKLLESDPTIGWDEAIQMIIEGGQE